MSTERVISSTPITEVEDQTNWALRAQSLDEYIGQAELIERVLIAVQAVQARQEAKDDTQPREHLEHVLLHGPPGLGKTTVRRRLTGEIKDIFSSGEGEQPSTGVVESGRSVIIRKLFSTTAVVASSEWHVCLEAYH